VKYVTFRVKFSIVICTQYDYKRGASSTYCQNFTVAFRLKFHAIPFFCVAGNMSVSLLSRVAETGRSWMPNVAVKTVTVTVQRGLDAPSTYTEREREREDSLTSTAAIYSRKSS
jgi:hypothetical protein